VDFKENIAEDLTVLNLVLNGDKDSYRVIVEKYRNKVYSCAFSVCKNETDAADISQEVFIRFYNNIEQFDVRRPLLPYLLKISVNCGRNLIRKRTRLAENLDAESDIELDLLATHEKTPLSGMLHSEKLQRVREMVESLPVNLREVCSLFYLSECSCTEVAGILNISESSVKVSLFRARKKLFSSFSREWRASQ
jgi:RNA polymerase sigma factor (sigma-70 family)